MQTDLAGTKAGAESIREKRVKLITSNLQQEMQKILSSCILTTEFPSTTIAFQFTVIELDSDLIQTMINCASLALFKSTLACRCLPVGITMFLKPTNSGDLKRPQNPNEWIQLDPNLAHIKNQSHYSHRGTMVWNVSTQELISQSLTPLKGNSSLGFKDLEVLAGVSYTIAKEVHKFIIGSADLQ